jgi:hypothetical protein
MPNYVTTILDDSPWGYWRFGESSGLTATDSSGNSRSGTISASGITYSQTGAIKADTNAAFLFSSGAGSVTLPTSNPFTGSSAWSMECWFKVAALPGSGVFYNMIRIGNPSGGAGTSSTVYLTGNFSGEVAWDDQSASILYGTPPSTNTYHHIVVTYAGGSSGTITLYFDSSSVGTATATMSLPSSTAPVIANNIAGDLDEVALYTTSLSSARVTAHYNAGIATLAYKPVNDGMGGVFS